MISNKRFNLRNDRFKKTNVDIMEGINRLQNSVLTKACILNGIIQERSFGEKNSSSFENENLGISVTELTSNSEQKNGHSITSSNSQNLEPNENAGNKVQNDIFSDYHRKKMYYTKLKLRKYDEEREKMISESMVEKMRLLKEKESIIKQELDILKQELKLARAKVELERTEKLLIEEEERENEAKIWKNYNEQLCNQRLKEANERIQKVFEKEKEAEELLKKQNEEKKLRLDKIHEYQILYRAVYEQLQEVIKTCKDNQALFSTLSDETDKLKQIDHSFEIIIDNCKTGNVSEEVVNEAAELIGCIKQILENFKIEIESVNLRHEEEIKKEEERLKEKEITNQNEFYNVNAEPDLVLINDNVDEASIERHLELKKFLADYESELQPLIADQSMKKFRFSCQMAINVPVNAISPHSKEHMYDKFLKLSHLLKGQSVPVSNGSFSLSSHPLGIKFCTYSLAKKFVNQGDQLVSGKPEAAFAIAAIIVALWVEFPDFGKLLLAQFQEKCPYLIPAYFTKIEGQSEEEYYKSLGYQYFLSEKNERVREAQDKFLKRMSGIMHLYAAVIISKPQSPGVQNPMGLKEAWRWIAATVNLEPRLDITATLLLHMLEVTGNELHKTYGLQLNKLFQFLCSDYYNRIQKIQSNGPVCRLTTFLKKFFNEGCIAPPAGLLSKDIW